MFAFIYLTLTITSFQIGILAAQGLTQYFQQSLSVNYTVAKSTSLTLPCIVRNRQGECLWLHDGLGLGYIRNKYVFSRTPDNGDCSLTIHDISLERDDGLWQCQVTQSSLNDKPLQSEVVSLTVLIAPGKPRIKKNDLGSRLERFALRETEVECSIARGNPPPVIFWYLNDENITNNAVTVTSHTPTPKPETLNTISTLRMTFKKEQNNATLMCVALHPLANQTDSAVLNLYYAPEVEVQREQYTIVEGNELSIPCKVDANPQATAIWRRSGTNSAVESNPQYGRNVLYFERVSRDLNGREYECTAQNDYGFAKPATVKFDVLYFPALVNISNTQSVLTGSRAQLYCNYDGNPSPVIRWYHINPRTGAVSLVKRAMGKHQNILDLVNVTYIQEGEYYCEGINNINGMDNVVPSRPIEVHVFGPPAFLTPFRLITGQRGEATDLTLAFCSDPAPYKVFWQFGSIKLSVRLVESLATPFAEGNKSLHERLIVGPLVPLLLKRRLHSASSCYESTLIIKDSDISDQRDYILVVENERGMSEGLVKLKVVQPLSATMVVATLLSIIAVVLVISIISLLLVKRKRKCKERVSYEESKEDAQVLSQNTRHCEATEEKMAVKTNTENNHELVYANLDFPKDPSKPPPTRPKPQIRPTHQRPMGNTGVGTEYAKLAFPTKADL